MIDPREATARRSQAGTPARLAALAVLSALLAAPLAAAAEIYRWTDENGVERFSDRIENVPEQYRRDVTAELGEDRPAAAETIEPLAPVVPEEPPAAPVPDAPDAPPAQLPDWSTQMLAMGAVTLVTALLFGFVGWLAVTALALRLACRLVGDEVPGWGRAFGVAVVQLLAATVVGAGLAAVSMAGLMDLASAPSQGLQVLLGFGVNALVIQAMLALSLGRALAVALVELLISVVIGLGVGVGIALLVAGLAATT